MIKNFLMTLRRYKVAGVLNIVGLTMAFVAFYVIASQVWYSVTYNRPLEDSDRVYMISPLWGGSLGENNAEWSANCPHPVTIETVEMHPQAVASTHFRSYAFPARIWNKRGEGDFQKLNLGSYDVAPQAIEVFGFDIIAGDADQMSQPNTIVISESAAATAGVEVGDQLYYEGGRYYDNMRPELPQTVVAIFKDFPKNTFLYNHHIFKNDNCKDGNGNNNWNYSHFVKFEKGADLELFKKTWMDKYAKWMLEMVVEWKEKYPDENFFEEGDEILPIRLIKLDRMYYDGNFTNEKYEQGEKSTTLTLAAIALVIVVIAFINFVNFFMALVPVRMRSVNICKVFGAGQGTLRLNFLFEAIGLVMTAFVLALGIIQALQGSFITGYVTSSLALGDNVAVLLIILALMLLLAVISAIYPAFFITRFNASLGVKEGYGNSLSGRRMRSILAWFQFAVAMVLIIVAATFWMQYRYMINYDIGLDRENIITFTSDDLAGKGETVVEKLQQYPDAVGVTASSSPLTMYFSRWGREYNGKEYMLNAWYVRWNMPQFFGIKVQVGDAFTDMSGKRKDMLISGNLHREIGVPAGHEVNNFTVCGVAGDFRLNSVVEDDIYTALCCTNTGFGSFYIRLGEGADVKAFTTYVKELVQEFSPNSDEPEVSFFNEKIANLYNSTKKATVAIGLFALLAVFIALMGVFGIVMFETQHRRSEIAIRKVYGAERGQLVGMLNNSYVKLVLAGFLAAAPVAWWITSRWLEQFANRISIPWWIFAVSLVAVLAVTVALVTLRSWKASGENPAQVVRS
ncbi:MAG: ABC transporter permease [Bacteroidales bacterium]|nr:ABC transporter permease [Bacteroidales bacterium]